MKGVNLGLKVIKRLFAVFLVLGALMSVEAWGNTTFAQRQAQIENTTFVKNAYNSALSTTQKVCKRLLSQSYKNISSIFNNIISILIATIAVFWLFKHLKTGTISREEVYKALMFVIVFVFVYVLLNSKNAYDSFINLFYIPQHLASAALSTGGGNTAEQLNQAFIMPYDTYNKAEKVGYETLLEFYGIILEKLGIGHLLSFLHSKMGLFFYALYVLLLTILIIAIIIMHIYSTFLSFIYAAFLPIMIPLLLIPQTKAIFFAWVKAFIGITMYVPLSMIPITILTGINDMMTADGENIWINTMYYSFLGLVFVVICYGLLSKIPTWISELLGTANQGVGAGGALGMLKTAGMGIGAAALGYGKGIASSITGSKSTAGKIGSTLANIATGGMYGGGLSAAKGVGGLIKNGFKTIGKHFSGKIK